MAGPLVRVTARVPSERGEEARAAALELAPEGFEESERDGVLTLALYVEESRAEAIRSTFAGAETASVEPGWEDTWRDFHHAIVVGGIWVGPPWEHQAAGGSAVIIDPGRAFGTGAHPTTRLCVELLSVAPRGSLLDVGCGSGVLAIAGVRLGFDPVVAVDDDPVAVEVTIANAAVNGVTLESRVVDAISEPLPRADVAVANILLGAVEQILPRIDAEHVVTSGYLAGERPAALGWRHLETRSVDGWAADLFARADG